MSISKSALPTEYAPKIVTSLVGAKSIASASAYKHGSVTVVELAFNDSTTGFIKVAADGLLELGGTAEMNTGTAVRW